MKFSKARVPKNVIGGKFPKLSYIVTSIILIAIMFLLAASCASSTFQETLESIANTLPDEARDKISTKVSSSSTTPGTLANKLSTKINSSTTPTTTPTTETTESFVGDIMYRDTPAPFPGSVINSSAWSPTINASESRSAPLSFNSLDVFKSAQYSPSCCAKGPGSGLSTSMGCVCLTNKDAYFITEGRGGNNMNPSAII